MNVIVIGGGAAGLAAAIAAAEGGAAVMLLERLARPGKKLLATGNGRCNLCNEDAPRYPGGGGFAKQVLAECGVRDVERFFTEHGLMLRLEQDGRVYPASGQASTVLDTLLLAAERAGVTLLTGQEVRELRAVQSGFQVSTSTDDFLSERVILCAGGLASPKLGGTDGGYRLLEALGHAIVKPFPALTQLTCDTAPIRGLSGIQLKAGLTLTRSGKRLISQTGTLLFTDYGLSGVAAMQCARWVEPGCVMHVDLRPALNLTGEVYPCLKARMAYLAGVPVQDFMTGMVLPRVARALYRAASLSRLELPAGALDDGELRRLADVISDFPLRVTGVKGFESAQVTAGGADTRDFDPRTMASYIVPGLFAAGEVLDVDGDCGGFNLLFAFASGLLAGAGAAQQE